MKNTILVNLVIPLIFILKKSKPVEKLKEQILVLELLSQIH